jgi:undecaprenyl-diphosphatase
LLHHLLQLDKQSLIWINSHHNLALDVVLVPVSFAGECGATWVLVGLGLMIFGKGGARRTGLVLLLTMLVVDRLIGAPLAHWAHRTRPYLAIAGVRQLGIAWKGSSFPSAHAHSVWIAAILLSSRWPKLRWPLIAFAVLTCYARPYLGLHYPSDVLAGTALGIAAGPVAVRLDRWLARKRDLHTQSGRPKQA